MRPLAPVARARHNRAVRWISIVALVVAGARAAVAAPAAGEPATTFWSEIIEPHGAAVAAIVTKARTAIGKANEVAAGGGDTVVRRNQYLSDAYGMLRYARKLSPENTEVLSLLGTTADDLGKTRQALDALESCARLQGPARATPEVIGRLGSIYLRLGRLDDAIRWLRHVQAPTTGIDNAAAVVHLATALAAQGDMARAIDTLTVALPTRIGYFTDPIALVSFALAVHYDRDEQRAAAFEVLDQMSQMLTQELGTFLTRALAAMRFAPAEDEYYYQALFYEALGDYTEARAEWMLYASIPDAPWRHRALDHVRAIDTQRGAAALSTSQAPRPQPRPTVTR